MRLLETETTRLLVASLVKGEELLVRIHGSRASSKERVRLSTAILDHVPPTLRVASEVVRDVVGGRGANKELVVAIAATKVVVADTKEALGRERRPAKINHASGAERVPIVIHERGQRAKACKALRLLLLLLLLLLVLELLNVCESLGEIESSIVQG